MSVQFYKPMLASNGTWDLTRIINGDFAVEPKLDGVRAMVQWDHEREGVVIHNRTGVVINDRFPEVEGFLNSVLRERAKLGDPDQPAVLDGEIVATTGDFEAVAQRDRQSNLASALALVPSMPCVFVGFDVWLPEYRPDELYSGRRMRLEELSRATGIPIVPNRVSVDEVRANGFEGVVVKHPAGTYRPGLRSTQVIKVKFKHRVTCIAKSYNPGKNGRSHMGALNLELADAEGVLVPVGHVGSGFTDAQTWEFKHAIDAGHWLLVEIECLGITSNNKLRQPAFKGIRSDLEADACTTAQLATIPNL